MAELRIGQTGPIYQIVPEQNELYGDRIKFGLKAFGETKFEYRYAQMIKHISTLISLTVEEGSVLAGRAAVWAEHLQIGTNVMGLTRIFQTTVTAAGVARAIVYRTATDLVKTVHGLADWALTMSYAALFFTGKTVFKTWASRFDLLTNGSDFVGAVQDLSLVWKLKPVAIATGEDDALQILNARETRSYLQITKAVSSFALAAFALMSVSLNPFTALAMSGGSTLSAVGVYCMDNGSKFEKIKLRDAEMRTIQRGVDPQGDPAYVTIYVC